MIRRRVGRANDCRAWPEAPSTRQSRASGCRTTSPRTLQHRTSTPGSRARAQAAPRCKGSDDRHVPVGHRRGRVDRAAGATGTLLQQIAIGMLNDVQCRWSIRARIDQRHCTSFSIPIAICCSSVPVAPAARSTRPRLWPTGTCRSSDPLHRGAAWALARDPGVDVRCCSVRGDVVRQPEARDCRVDGASGHARQSFARPTRRRIIDLLDDNGGFR